MKSVFAALALAAVMSTAQADVGLGFDQILRDTVQVQSGQTQTFPVAGFDQMLAV